MMQTPANNAYTDDRVVATALRGVIVRGERNRLAETAAPGIDGARAALETFYHAFNTRSVDLAQRIWADDPLVQLVSPVGGLVRGSAGIAAAYARGFSGALQVQTVLEDIVAYVTPEMVVFAGRERGTYTHDSAPQALSEFPARFVKSQQGRSPRRRKA
jgi:hypothetical protein